MRMSLSFCIAVIGLTLGAQTAVANVTFQLKGRFSESHVKGACAKAGAEFNPSTEGSTYGCVKYNCDGKGGHCGVECEKGSGKCTGTTPSRQSSGRESPVQILTPQLLPSRAEPIGPGMSDNVDRAGSDFQSFQMSARAPAECQAVCTRTRNCKAWTYVRPGVQTANAVCYLKNSIPVATRNNCCISGIKPSAVVRDHRVIPEERDHRDGPTVRDHRN